MMRALYSSVAGLKTHQTKMDVIGNNIANVNTVGFKSTRVTFSTMMYQKTSSASGANAETGKGGVNEKQIGLGSNFASTMVSIATGGASESTGNAFDLKIADTNSTSFFVVYNGSENVFTRAGAFYVDGAGNLCMESTGYTVMGWQVDANGNIRKDTVSPLRVMAAENQTSDPEYTTKAICSGILDDTNSNVNSETGYAMNLNFYDNLGYAYTARFAVQKDNNEDGAFNVNLTDILDASGKSIVGGVELSKLFGTGSEENTQGSGVDITDNYVIAAGKSAALKSIANTLSPSNQRIYNYTGETLNSILGTSFPSDATIEYTTVIDANSDLPDILNAGANGTTNSDYTIKVVSASGEDITGNYIMTSDDDKISSHVIRPSSGTAYTPGKGYTAKGATITKVETVQTAIADLEKNGQIIFKAVARKNGTNQEATITLSELKAIYESLGLTSSDYPDGLPNKTVTIVRHATKDADGIETVSYDLYKDLETTADLPSTADTADLSKSKNTAKNNSEGNIQKNTNLYEQTILNRAYLTTTGDVVNNQDIFTEKLPSDAEVRYNVGDGSFTIVTPKADGFKLKFSTADGHLEYIGQEGSTTQSLRLNNIKQFSDAGNFSDIAIDFTTLKNLANGASCTGAMSGGDEDGSGKGKKVGALTGLSVDGSGKVFGTYDNGNTALLGQIAVARFANASGLESIGDNCFKTTLNSGEFDGIGVEIDADGSSISTGVLEMSNVDLATEFTQMITTQRGYQANSRVITTSDSILEELINLKR